MKTTTALGLSTLIVLTLAAFTETRPTILPPVTEFSSFLAELHGDLHASPRGTARFGAVGWTPGDSSPRIRRTRPGR